MQRQLNEKLANNEKIAKKGGNKDDGQSANQEKAAQEVKPRKASEGLEKK